MHIMPNFIKCLLVFVQVEDEKVRFALAKRYFTETYFRIFRRVNKIELGFSEDENAHMKIEASLQKKCPKDVRYLTSFYFLMAALFNVGSQSLSKKFYFFSYFTCA